MREDVIDKVLQIINCNMENTELSAKQIEEDLSILGMDCLHSYRCCIGRRVRY